MIYVLYFIVWVIFIYAVRHYCFTLSRLFGFQRHPYIDIDAADWPPATVLVAAPAYLERAGEPSTVGDLQGHAHVRYRLGGAPFALNTS